MSQPSPADPIDSPRPASAARRPWVRRMSGRDPDEEHRASTPLELFFDLGFVVSVAFAAAGLHHGLSDGHYAHAIGGYLLVFFPIWWAWMNFTWFASAYDTDDGLYRITTLVQIAGALVLAAGVPAAMEDRDLVVITWGYVVMRLAVVGQWVRASASDPAHRPTTVRYAIGVAAVQLLWLARLTLPEQAAFIAFFVLVAAELAVPAWAERRTMTSWHPEHITERYGLFTLIVMGEVLLGATTAVQAGLSAGGHAAELIRLAGCGLIIVFALWWLYFETPAHHLLSSLPMSLRWGYGHYAIFAAVAALGAGLEVAIDARITGGEQAHAAAAVASAAAGAGLPDYLPGLAIAVPVTVFLVGLWALQILPRASGRSSTMRVAMPIGAVLILAGTAASAVSILWTAIVCAGLACLSAVRPSDERPPRRVRQ